MPKAIVFFDLDGTLLADDKSVSQDNLAALQALRANDVLPVIATGRNIFEIQYVLDQTGIDAIVSANGSYVIYRGKKLAAATIPVSLIEAFNAFAKQQGDPVAWYNATSFGLSGTNADTMENYRLLKLHPDLDPTWYQQHDSNFMFVFNRDKEALYQREFAGQLDLVRNNARGLDTMLAGVSKSTGIQHLVEDAGLTGIPTYGFGDALNDIPMLKLVDHPVVMGNGDAQMKKLAEFVTTSNMAGGIRRGLAHYGLVNR